MRFDVLDRIVGGVGIERVDRVHAVETVPPDVARTRELR
jgi:hypothetical protein